MTELDNGVLYFNSENVLKFLSKEWKVLVAAVENSLKSYSAGKVVQPVRSAVPVEKNEGILLVMPAYNIDDDALASKIVTVFPQNKKKNLPSIQSTVLLNDAKTGKLKAIMDGDIITEMRTAAASVVASKYLAHKAEILAILGAGAQARSHYQAFCSFYNVKKILVWNINKESATKLANEINEKGLNCILCDSVESAVRDADIIITVTMATKPILRKEWVKEGTHINAVGAPVPEWRELETELMLSSVLYVDSTKGALTESGDIIQSKATIFAEIGEVILGIKEPLPHKTTIFKSLGMAVEDVAVAELVYKTYLSQIYN